MTNINYEIISLEEAEKKFNKSDYEAFKYITLPKVLVFNQDIILNENFDDWLFAFIRKIDFEFYGLVIINGNIQTKKHLFINEYNLLVLGDISCNSLRIIDWSATITGDAFINTTLGYDGHGDFSILGKTTVPFVFMECLSLNIKPTKNTIIIIFSYNGCFDYKIDFNRETFPKVANEQIIELCYEPDEEEGEEKEYCFESTPFTEFLMQGKSPFKNISDEDFSLSFDKDELMKLLLQ